MLSELALFGYLGIKCSVVAYWFVNEGIHKLRQKLVWGWDFQFFLKTNEKITRTGVEGYPISIITDF